MCTASLVHSNRCAGLAPNNSLMLSPSIIPLPGAGSCSRDQPPPLLHWASVICYSMWLRAATWPEAQRLSQGRGEQEGCVSPCMVWTPGSLPCSKGPSPCSCLSSWVSSTQINSSVAPLGAASLQKSWELQRDQVPAVTLSWTDWSTAGSVLPDVAFQGISSSLKVLCMQGGCELGAALNINSAVIFLRLFVLYPYQLYSFSPFIVCILKKLAFNYLGLVELDKKRGFAWRTPGKRRLVFISSPSKFCQWFCPTGENMYIYLGKIWHCINLITENIQKISCSPAILKCCKSFGFLWCHVCHCLMWGRGWER